MVELPELTIHNVAVAAVGKEKLQEMLDIAAAHGVTYWDDADHYYSLGVADQHVMWFEHDIGINGNCQGQCYDRTVVPYETFLALFKEYYAEMGNKVTNDTSIKMGPNPRYRQRKRQKPTVAKTIVRVLYTTQQVYTLKNVRNVQIIDDKVFIQYERDITDGIKENSEVEIDGNLVMAVVIHEVDNRSNFFRNIDGTWDYQNQDGTVINSGKQLGRIFKK